MLVVSECWELLPFQIHLDEHLTLESISSWREIFSLKTFSFLFEPVVSRGQIDVFKHPIEPNQLKTNFLVLSSRDTSILSEF